MARTLRAALTAALALSLAPLRSPAWGNSSAVTLADMVKSNKLGLSQQEMDAAMVRLRLGAAPRDLNRSKVAKAMKGMALLGVNEGKSAFDGNEAVSLRSFEASAPRVSGHAIDEKTGGKFEFTEAMQNFMSLQEEGTKVHNMVTVGGACSNEPSTAILALQNLVRSKVESGRAARGEFADFFLYLYLLFFHSRYKDQLPLVDSGVINEEKTVATFQHTDKGGTMVFDCDRYKGLGAALQRKIACHEFYHKFSPENGEPSAYSVMSEC